MIGQSIHTCARPSDVTTCGRPG